MQMTKGFFFVFILLLTLTFGTACRVFSEGGGGARKEDTPFRRSGFMEPPPLSLTWHPVKGPDAPKAIALVVHGLNLLPEKMESIISILTENGVEALNLSLTGHGEDRESGARLEALKGVTYLTWSGEVHRAYKEAFKRNHETGAPLVFIGFSLGGLLGVDMIETHPEARFKKMVLFAPALTMRPRNYIIRLLSLFPRLTVPSLTPKSYQANDGIPMAAYNAFFEALSHFKKNISRRINISTLILVDEQDEFVSVEGLRKLVARAGLDQWKLYVLEKRAVSGLSLPHHLIIDELSLGDDLWKEVGERTIRHLTPLWRGTNNK